MQWNGTAENRNDVERLGRNVGEVLGVFAEAQFHTTPLFGIPKFRTSARRLNQVKLENHLKQLWSPVWPEHLGAIDEAQKEAGRMLFEQHCVHCHEVIPHGMQHQPVTVEMTSLSEVGTDPRMAMNAAAGTARTGDLARLFGSRKKVPRGEMLQKLVRLSIITPYRDVGERGLAALINSDDVFSPKEIKAFLKEIGVSRQDALGHIDEYERKLTAYYKELRSAARRSRKAAKGRTPAAVSESAAEALRYKARPLDGIWATAPYLHNGSVPNLYELLLPAEERSKTFFVGSNEFDPKKVGFSTEQVPGSSRFDTSKPGNSNMGHDMYGTFSDDERWQLVEYMKSL